MQDIVKIDPNISSSEMTAYWRSIYPQLSGDKLSVKLSSDNGICKSHEFEKKFDYPLVSRKVSVRAGFFLKQSVDLILTGRFDSCISFASGFSLLSYYIAMAIQEIFPDIILIDTDLPNIIKERENRLQSIANELNEKAFSKVKSMVCDLELAASENRSIKDIFPDVKSPIFLIEGVIYFLSKACVDWITREVSQYENSAIIMDYWPENGMEESKCFKQVVESLKGFIPENIKSFWDEESLKKLYNTFDSSKDIPIQYLEHQYSTFSDENPKFYDKNSFFPVHLLVAANGIKL